MAGLARFSIRFRYPIIALWIIAGALCIALFPSLSSAVNTDNSSFLPANSPSVHAMNLAAPFQPTKDSTGTLVVLGKSKLTSSDQQAISNLEKKIAKDNHVVSVSDQGLSKDGKVQKAQIVINVLTSSTDASPTVANIRSTISGTGLSSGLSGYLTGQLPSAVDNQNSQAHAQKLTEDLSVLVILIMLIFVFRAVGAPLVTLLPAIWVLLMSGAIIAEASTAGLQVSTITQTMLTVLLLGAGTDYGLFFIMRVREEMAEGASPHTAIERSGRYVGESITFSAGTVIVALLTLLLASFGLYSGLGPALALGVALMLLAALTLLPALLAVSGHVVFWPRPVKPNKREGLYAHLADRVIAHPVITLVAGVVFLGVLGIFAADYTSSGFGGQTTGPAGSQSANGTNVINNHYPPAVANPTQVLLVYKSSVWNNLSQLNKAENDLGKKSVFSSVSGPFNPNGTQLTPSQLQSLYAQLGPPGKLPATEPAGTPVPTQQYDLYRATAQFISSDGKTVQFYTALSAGSPSTTAALNAVPDMRSATTSVQHADGATDSGVAGLAPSSYDVSSVSQTDLTEIVPVVIILLALLLGLLLRSVIAPLYLVATVLISYFAALGIAVLIFQIGVGDSGLNFVLPFLLFIFLMALGEDYNILVMSRIREEAHHAPLRSAVRTAAHHTGSTVTSAGLILAATFGVAGITGATSQIKQLGIAIALGVLIDTFLVRTLMVPAIVVLCRRWNWWPSHLARRSAQIPGPVPPAGRQEVKA
ncbi:MAG TPA: MMPL family transporter [Streptosporangiaceae bacterium]|nr:MMPL family transporter [Streptosporangiaceae bacterium]